MKEALFVCMECNKKFYTVKSAEKASWNGCPKCGGGDIEVYCDSNHPNNPEKCNDV